jgi:hypothetical protein
MLFGLAKKSYDLNSSQLISMAVACPTCSSRNSLPFFFKIHLPNFTSLDFRRKAFDMSKISSCVFLP